MATDRRNMIQKFYYTWDKPALDQAVVHLCAGWHSGPIDLRDRLILVPTRHAGRRLRERLAMAAAERSTGVLVGLVETPAYLFSPKLSSIPVAAGAAADLLWRRVLEGAGKDVLSALGRATMGSDAAARVSSAAHLRSLRDQLCEEGHDFRSFARIINQHFPEDRARWEALSALEASYCRIVQDTGWRDDVSEKLHATDGFALPPDITRIVKMFVPDPPPLALRVLDKMSQHVAVEVCIHAPSELQHTLDAWGRPSPAIWTTRALALNPEHVEACDDSITAAERIREAVEACKPVQRRNVVVGVSDPQSATRISTALARDGVGTFNPSGIPVLQLPLFVLVDRLLRLARKRSIDSLDLLLRHPFVIRRLEADLLPRESLLAVWDEFVNQHMPSSLEYAVSLCDHYFPGAMRDDDARREECKRLLRGMLDAVQKWLAALHRNRLSSALPELLADLTDGCAVDDMFEKEARILTENFNRLATIEPWCRDHEEAADMLRLLAESQVIGGRRREDDIDVLGWLELPWEDAPVLLLTDLNDGLIPESVTVDAFLPDGTRTRAGLRDNSFRLARDAYLLDVLAHARPAGGLRGFMARRSPGGDLLKPSRLLFLGLPEDVPSRVLHYFREGSSAFVATDRTPALLLKGPSPDIFADRRKFSPSDIKTYLQCPFRYYLAKAVKLGDPFVRKRELDALDFGNVVHEVFYAFARSPLAHELDAGAIERFLHAELDRYLARRFGEGRPLALVIQRDIIRQRLTYAARAQAAWRAEGWKILPDECERSGEIMLGEDRIVFRVDRMDKNELTGAVCVLDYKTSQKATKPDRAHIDSDKAGLPPEKAFAAAAGEGSWWVDVQLPLYASVARERMADRKGPVQAAYFSIPGAVAETTVQIWKDFGDRDIDSALACARNVFERIRSGIFWPPAQEISDREAEINLFFDGISQHLDPGTLRQLEERAT